MDFSPRFAEKVCIITTDGRNLVGTLASHDNTTNLVSKRLTRDMVHMRIDGDRRLMRGHWWQAGPQEHRRACDPERGGR